MVSQRVKITNEQGLHMRPANELVSAMVKFKSDIFIVIGEKRINGKSIMNIIASCIKFGSEIEVECVGEDEQEALNEAVTLIESGFGE